MKRTTPFHRTKAAIRERYEAWVTLPDGRRVWGMIWRCANCTQLKPEHEFYMKLQRGKRKPDSWCKACVAEKKKQYPRKYSPEAARRYYEARRERSMNYQREYYARNRDLILSRRRQRMAQRVLVRVSRISRKEN